MSDRVGKEELVLPTRLNREPVVILGLTRSELLLITAISVGVSVPVCLVLAIVAGKWALGMALGCAVALIGVVSTGMWFGRIKRQRPDGYYQQRFLIGCTDCLGIETGFIRHRGCWDARRQSLSIRQQREALYGRAMERIARGECATSGGG